MNESSGFLTHWAAPIVIGSCLGLAWALAETRVAEGVAREALEREAPAAVEQVRRSTSGRRDSPQQSVASEDGEFGDVLAAISELEKRRDELLRVGNRDAAECTGAADCERWYAPTQALLDEWARCARLPIDVPTGLLTGSSQWFADAALSDIAATEREREELRRATEELSEEFHARFLRLHEEIVAADASRDRPTHALVRDLRAMRGLIDDDAALRRRVAQERAGAASSLPALDAEPMTQFYRELAGLGDEIEDRVAQVVGRNRAKKMRQHGNGWGSRLDDPPSCTESE